MSRLLLRGEIEREALASRSRIARSQFIVAIALKMRRFRTTQSDGTIEECVQVHALLARLDYRERCEDDD